MRKTILAALWMCVVLAVTGCGDDWYDDYYYPYPYPPFSSQFLSNPAFDGYISKDPVTGAFTVTQGMSSTVQSVVAGTNPATTADSRAFINFPGVVPGSAIINSGVLNIFVNSIQTVNGSIRVLIDLVSAPPPLIEADFESTPLASISTTFFQSDLGQYVEIDVTALMVQAQTMGLGDFQMRISVQTPPGFIEINDTTGANRGQLAPILYVTSSF